MPTDFEAVFYVSRPPNVEFRDGLFHISFGIGRSAHFEVVMSPNTFIKMRRANGIAAAQFHEGGENVVAMHGDDAATG